MQRVYRLLALRGVGLPLEEIGPLLDVEDGIGDTVRRHLDRVEQQLSAIEALRLRLTRLLAALDGDGASTAQFLDAMEAMTMFEKYYTPDQLQQLEKRRLEFGEDVPPSSGPSPGSPLMSTPGDPSSRRRPNTAS